MPAQVYCACSKVQVVFCTFPSPQVDVHAQMWDGDDQLDGTDHPLLCWVLAAC